MWFRLLRASEGEGEKLGGGQAGWLAETDSLFFESGFYSPCTCFSIFGLRVQLPGRQWLPVSLRCYFILFMYVCPYVCLHTMCVQWPQRPEESVDYPGTRGTDGCELPCGEAGTSRRTQDST